jgi:hypothetical protein
MLKDRFTTALILMDLASVALANGEQASSAAQNHNGFSIPLPGSVSQAGQSGCCLTK